VSHVLRAVLDEAFPLKCTRKTVLINRAHYTGNHSR